MICDLLKSCACCDHARNNEFNFLIYGLSWMIMSVNNFRFLFYIFWFLIVASSFFFPSLLNEDINFFQSIGDSFAEVRFFKKTSNFPAALSATYSIAVIFGCILGVMSISSRELIGRSINLANKSGRFRCFSIALIVIFTLLVVIFFENRWILSEREKLFLLSISESRFHLAFWCSAIFLLIASSLATFFASIVGFIFSEGVDGRSRFN